jgi:opacity protein-like surface antigen
MRKALLKVAALAFLTVSGALAAAQAPAGPSDQADDGWQFEVTPYFWLVGLQGEIETGGLIGGSIDASFSEILKSLDFGIMGTFQARKGRVGFFLDAMYGKLSKSGQTSGPLADEAKVELVMQTYAVAVSYRLLEGRIPLDIVGGVRVMPIQAALEVTSGALEGSQASGGGTSVDGFAGARLALPLTRRLTADAYADLGAGDSTLTWQALSGLSYRLSRTVSARAGFRYLSIENEEPDIRTKIGEGGFYAGCGIRF